MTARLLAVPAAIYVVGANAATLALSTGLAAHAVDAGPVGMALYVIFGRGASVALGALWPLAVAGLW